MTDCNIKDICYNYPKHCALCQATSDMVNHYPCFQDKDIVEVVRCKDCKFWNNPKREYADAFCCHGKTKEKV